MMGRLLVMICFLAVGFAGCKKSEGTTAERLAQAEADDKLIADYISSHNLTTAAKVKITGSSQPDTAGVWCVIDNPGTGNNPITTSSLLTVSYTGRILTSGTVFAQTGSTFHPSYRLGETIRGWQLGLLYAPQKLKKGAKVRLLVASRYGYGPFPQNGIPENSVLDFDIEIFDITN